jgi:ABC-type glycerol-3-phosphate transport system permease component
MISRTVCDRFKHRPQRYRTNGKRENRRKKNGDKRGPLFGVGLLCSLFFPLFLLSSLFAVLAAYRLVRVRYTHRMAHMCALVFSFLLIY